MTSAYMTRTEPTENTDSQVLTPARARMARAHEIGGKAAGLLRLANLDAPVPPWFVISSSAFLDHLASSPGYPAAQRAMMELERISPEEDPAGFMRLAHEVSGLFEAVILEKDLAGVLQAEIERALGSLLEDADAIAVRSSMVGEDSEQHSFAGQLESFLFQRELAQVLDSVKRCWASAFSAHALMYRRRAGLPLGFLQVGVILQAMIDGEVSGVMFTANPISGRADHVLITSAWGVGEGIVSGACNTDEFVCERGLADEEVEISAKLAHKDVMLARAEGGGTIEQQVLPDRQHIRSLSRDEVVSLYQWARKLDALEGAPFDVEWTLRGGELFLLQARPITTALAPPAEVDGPRTVFDNANIQESYCGVTTPLTYSFAAHAYQSVYIQTFRVLGLPEAELEVLRPVLGNLLSLIDGRIYYNLNNWYKGLQILPSFGQNKEDMESMMGVEEPVDFIEDEVLSWAEKVGRMPQLLKTWARLQRRFSRLDRDVPEFLARFEELLAGISREQMKEMTFSELFALMQRIEGEFLQCWDTPIVNDFYTMMSVGKLRRAIERAGFSNVDEMLADLLGGQDGIESTEPTHELMRIAKLLREAEEEDYPALISSMDPLEFLATVQHRSPTRWSRIERYIERYGDRTMGELKLETVTLRQDPRFLVKVLANYIKRPDIDPDALRQQERSRMREAVQLLRAKTPVLERRRLGALLEAARDSVKHRENMRLARTRLFGIFRSLYSSIGQRLADARVLEHTRDVFFLTREELNAYFEGRAVTTNLAGLVALRRVEFGAFEKREVSHRIMAFGPVYIGNAFASAPVPQESLDASVLQGTGCYAGVVEANLAVVMSPDDELDLDGQILTTLRTDPGWAPLFPTAGGILVERGSTLSHSAVVARELGIPAVVGVPNLLAIVRDGERVRLDGGAGSVTRMEVAPDQKSEEA